MRNLLRGIASVALYVGIALAGITIMVAVVALFIWQYNSFAPWLPGVNNEWWQGYIHGMFIITNVIVNIVNGQAGNSLFAANAGVAYTIFYVLGIMSLAGGGSAARRRS